ncbi:MAG: hypothetical protein U0869_11645 [Chloroflexota bacterium]
MTTEDPARAGGDTTTGTGAEGTDPAAIGRIERQVQELNRRFDTRDRLEIVAGLILALAAVVAAWSAYQNARWGGHQAAATSAAATLRTSAAQATSIAAAELDLDTQMFVAWLGAAASGDATTATAYADRMRTEFRPVFDAWLFTAAPGTIPAGSPIDTPAYDEQASGAVLTARQANHLADLEIAKAAEANQTGDNFVLVTVIMSMVLFCAGIATRFGHRRVRRGLVALAGLLLVGGTLFMLSLPVSFAI